MEDTFLFHMVWFFIYYHFGVFILKYFLQMCGDVRQLFNYLTKDLKNRKLIHLSQQNFIECDNCDYVIKNQPLGRSYESYFYQNCPVCSCNLLNPPDYWRYVSYMNKVNWINKWFGWLGSLPQNTEYTGTVSFHKNLKITEDEK